MRTEAALLWEPGPDRDIRDVDLGDSVARGVHVQLAATGLCRSDEHADY